MYYRSNVTYSSNQHIYQYLQAPKDAFYKVESIPRLITRHDILLHRHPPEYPTQRPTKPAFMSLRQSLEGFEHIPFDDDQDEATSSDEEENEGLPVVEMDILPAMNNIVTALVEQDVHEEAGGAPTTPWERDVAWIDRVPLAVWLLLLCLPLLVLPATLLPPVGYLLIEIAINLLCDTSRVVWLVLWYSHVLLQCVQSLVWSVSRKEPAAIEGIFRAIYIVGRQFLNYAPEFNGRK
ncbi:hypothetical protein BDV93DRAFT_504671 [Ceratobasidium sp. AG-I]|nr:hypothetical protein BDV93DRAFT_504671 [Ceratobasidium sp. AG-I]